MEVFEDGALQAVNRIVARYGQATLNMKISVGDGGMENPLEKDVEH